MKLKAIVLAAALTLPLSVLADDMGSNPFAGAFVGVGLGVSSVNLVTKTTNSSTDLGKAGFAGRVFGGYNFNVSNGFLVGLMAEYNYNGSKVGLSNTNTNEATIRNTYGVDVDAGYMLSQDNMVYLGLGWAHGKARIDLSNVGYGKSRNGLKIMAGMQQNLSNNLSLGEDVSYTHFKSFNISSGSTWYTPKVLAATVNLSYGFSM